MRTRESDTMHLRAIPIVNPHHMATPPNQVGTVEGFPTRLAYVLHGRQLDAIPNRHFAREGGTRPVAGHVVYRP